MIILHLHAFQPHRFFLQCSYFSNILLVTLLAYNRNPINHRHGPQDTNIYTYLDTGLIVPLSNVYGMVNQVLNLEYVLSFIDTYIQTYSIEITLTEFNLFVFLSFLSTALQKQTITHSPVYQKYSTYFKGTLLMFIIRITKMDRRTNFSIPSVLRKILHQWWWEIQFHILPLINRPRSRPIVEEYSVLLW